MPPARSHFISAPDGLRLHAIEYGERTAPGLPVVCLPGLSRSAADFHEFALALAGETARGRRVIAVDYRGRGRSAYAADPAQYALPVELADLMAVLTALGVGPAVMVGTSRGGLLTMLLAAAAPTRIAGAVLNDIGPVIEPQGLMRIKGYVGKLPQPRSLDEGAAILRGLFAGQFPRLAAADWLHAARLTWRERDGDLVLNYDPRLAHTLMDVNPERPLAAMWPQFDALARVPVMVIRGALSDLLSAETVAAMRRRRRGRLAVVEVAEQGHPPVIGAPDLVARIRKFLVRCEQAAGIDLQSPSS